MSAVIIDYTNWRGEQRERHVVPQYIVFGSTEHHPGQQWLLVAHDIEKGVRRAFAMAGIHSWRNTEAYHSDLIVMQADDAASAAIAKAAGDAA